MTPLPWSTPALCIQLQEPKPALHRMAFTGALHPKGDGCSVSLPGRKRGRRLLLLLLASSFSSAGPQPEDGTYLPRTAKRENCREMVLEP